MRKIGITQVVGLIGEAQDKGLMVFAPMFLEAMPGVVRAAYIQRVASQLAEQAATLVRMCGDAVAVGLSNKGDVADLHLAELHKRAIAVRAMALALPPSADVAIGTDQLAAVYRQPQAARVMATKDGGL